MRTIGKSEGQKDIAQCETLVFSGVENLPRGHSLEWGSYVVDTKARNFVFVDFRGKENT